MIINYLINIIINKIPDLLVTIFGVFIGGILTFGVAKWQISKQSKLELERDYELLKLLFNRVKLEIRDNKNTLTNLREVLGSSRHARVDVFVWADKVADSISFEAYNKLKDSGLHRKLDIKIENEIYTSYKMTDEIFNMVKASLYKVKFYYGYGKGQEEIDKVLNDLKVHLNTVNDHLIYSINLLNNYNL
ncbi:hypothetical protein [Natronospora cellulosivora (SeqCode)]